MPSVSDVIEAADLLKVRSIEVIDERCSAIRNRNASCRACENACIESAITVERNEVRIDVDACVDCGACVPVCPNGALVALEPLKDSLHREVRSKATAARCGIIACSRIAARRTADDALFTEVPCLGHIGEEDLIKLIGQGIDDIILVDGECATCKYGAVSADIDTCVDIAATFFEKIGADAVITRASEFPPEIRTQARNFRGESRRGLIFQVGDYVKNVAGNVAQKTIEEKLGTIDKPKTLYERLRAGKNGKMPSFEPSHNYGLLESGEAALARTLGSVEEAQSALRESEETLDCRHFGDLEIDASACSGCGLCVLFCPTEACVYSEVLEAEDEDSRIIEFRAMDCTQCRLCEDVCIRKCLTISPKVSIARLYDFEPKAIAIPKPKNRTSIMDLKRIV